MNIHQFSPGMVRSALSLIGLLSTMLCLAQRAPELAYTIQFSTVIDQAQEKFIHEGLRSQDPDALVWINALEQNVLTCVHATLDRDQLQTALAPCGLVITYFGRPRADHAVAKSTSVDSEEPMPAFKDTGDPSLDNARYEVEKKAWIDAHPATYEQLTSPR